MAYVGAPGPTRSTWWGVERDSSILDASLGAVVSAAIEYVRGDPPGGRGGHPGLVAMIRELAEFENLTDQVSITRTTSPARCSSTRPWLTTGWSRTARGGLAAHALWYRTFSTFLGKTGIWLEDIYVRPEHRRQGYATQLLTRLRQETEGRLEWEVLEWNVPAMDFWHAWAPPWPAGPSTAGSEDAVAAGRLRTTWGRWRGD